MEKGLWYANVNENYFHVATAAQDWVRNQQNKDIGTMTVMMLNLDRRSPL